MPSSILNSDDGVISGTSGLKSSGGDDGNLVFQSKGTETARINTDKQIVAAAGTASLPALTTTGDLNTGIFFPAADTIAFAEGGAEAMRITSDSTIGMGTSSPSLIHRLTVENSGTVTQGIRINLADNNKSALYIPKGFINGDSEGATGRFAIGNYGDNSSEMTVATRGFITFYTGATDNATGTERMRIASTGAVTTPDTASAAHSFGVSRVNGVVISFRNAAASNPYGAGIQFTAATPNNTTEYFLNCSDSTNDKLTIFSSGTVTNRTGTYNSFSDLKLKQDIVDASSQWDDIKALRIVKYRLKDEVAADPNYPAYIGLVAQEVEQVSAGLVDDCPDFEEVEVTDEEGNVTTERQATGTVTKSVKYSILYMKAVKALQEAMERIETLEAKNDALEARIAALEQA
jgi:hypothetical protein